MSSSLIADHDPPPTLYAVVDPATNRIIARGLSEERAKGRTSTGGGMIVAERIAWENPEAVMLRGYAERIEAIKQPRQQAAVEPRPQSCTSSLAHLFLRMF